VILLIKYRLAIVGSFEKSGGTTFVITHCKKTKN
jgi:hypothetical protein